MLKRLLTSGLHTILAGIVGGALVLGAVTLRDNLRADPATAGTMPTYTSFADPTAIGIANKIATDINALGLPGGAGNTNAALTIANVATAVNALQITAGGTGVPLQLGCGSAQGQTVDTNCDIAINPNGSGSLRLGGSATWTANGSANVTISNVGPSGIVATISRWIAVKDQNGKTNYIPAWSN